MRWHRIYFIGLFGLMGCIEMVLPVASTPPTPTTPVQSSDGQNTQDAQAGQGELTVVSPQPTPTLFVTGETASPEPEPDTSNTNDDGWEALAVGLERRWEIVEKNGRRVDTLYLLRIDPDHYRFGIGYSPGEPKTLSMWRRETEALIVLNGGYFTPEYNATGLTIMDGDVTGWPYQFGGMLDIRDGVATVRSLIKTPYVPDTSINFALQAFPILVQPGGINGYEDSNIDPARRTMIGQDKNGRIILLVTNSPSFTLTALSEYLLASDLDLEIALNLDGGSSSGIAVNMPNEGLSGFTALPIVITVHKK